MQADLIPGCHSQGKMWKTKSFAGQGKVRECCGWPGKFRKDLESQGKVREFENKWLWQSSETLFILFKRGKDVLSNKPISLFIGGYSERKAFFSLLGCKFFPL